MIGKIKNSKDIKNLAIILFKWCRVSESNQGHEDFQSSALPTELSGHIVLLLQAIIELSN